jgi:hypothetical protein
MKQPNHGYDFEIKMKLSHCMIQLPKQKVLRLRQVEGTNHYVHEHTHDEHLLPIEKYKKMLANL